MTRDQCVARTFTGLRCPFAARHAHETPDGRLRLCQVHLRTIKRRERLGSEADLLARWRA